MSDEIRDLAEPLRSPADLDPLVERVRDCRVVLVGEASHGTSDFYGWRAALTRRLIEEAGFGLVAVEGDWPECYQVNRSVRLRPGAEASPRRVLDGFRRWPTWMWANEEVVEFVEWLQAYNWSQPDQDRVGFYGLDVYGLWESMHHLVGYLREHEPQHVEHAVAALRCFEPYGEDPRDYALASRFAPQSCESAVVELLSRLCRERSGPAVGDDPEARFAAEQDAAVAAGAERYYRAMVQGSDESWNVRDTHMADTLDRLLDHHGRTAVVWEHNTHVGDARATDMAAAGLVNLGQLARERHGRERVALVGLGTHRGRVVAADRWEAPMRRLPVPPGRRGSVEQVLHERLGGDGLFVFPDGERPPWLTDRLRHRAIGVVYDPSRDRSQYVPTVLGERYDAFLHLEDTRPVRPLHLEPEDTGEPQTWPWTV